MPIGVYPRTEKHRIALSKAQKRNPVRYWLGKSRSKETKEKISDRLKGRKLTDEHKINIKEGRKKYLKKHPELMKGSKHPCWRGGRAIIKDCIYILRPDHPYANNHGYVKEHPECHERYNARKRERYKNEPDFRELMKERDRKFKVTNPEYNREYQRKWRRTHPGYYDKYNKKQ